LAVTTTSAPAAVTTATTTPPPPPVLAASDQKLVLLDGATGKAIRTLFDLGASKATDVSPPSVGSAALSADGQTAFFDVVSDQSTGTMKRVPTRGGTAEDLGAGRAPTPSPNGAVLAFLRANPGHADTVVLRGADGTELQAGLGGDDVTACGTVAWSPDSKHLAVDLCSNGEPTTVAEVDAVAAKATVLSPPESVRWTAPAYRADGPLTLAEDRNGDAVVVTVANGKVTGAPILRRGRTTLVCLEWDKGTSLLFCEADGSIWASPAGGDPHVLGTGYHAAAW
jgi:hypothetical protein